MTTLNSIGMQLGELSSVHAITDVTGFGLLGHLIEMCEGSDLSAEMYYSDVPVLPNINSYLDLGCIPGGTDRNWSSYGHKVNEINNRKKHILADPQTSGGLLISLAESGLNEFNTLMEDAGFGELALHPIGKMQKENNNLISVKK